MRYKKGDYFIIPNREALRELDCTLQSVYLNLCSRADDNGRCFPSYDTLAKESGVGRSTAVEAVKKLEHLGFIEKSHRKGSDGSLSSNDYRLLLVGVVQELDGGSPGAGRGVVHQTTSNDNHINDNHLTSETKVSRVSVDSQDDIEMVSVDDWGEEIVPRWKKKDTSYLKVFEMFGDYPKSWTRNTTQIKAAKALLAERDEKMLKNAIDFYQKNAKKPFIPEISTPYDLDTKWEKLVQFKDKKKHGR